MKKFLVAAFAFILMFTEVLPSVQVNAAETTDPCEEKAFTIMPFISGDDSLKGEGRPGEEIDLQFEDMERTIEVDEEGHFEYIWEEKAPETDDTITLTNAPYEVEWTVEAEMSGREEIEAEMVDTCDVTVPSEEIESVEGEDSVEEEATEGDFSESGEAEEKETPEESTEEPSPEEGPEESGAKEGTDEATEMESSEEAGLTEESEVEESDGVVLGEDTPTEEVSSEAPVEEKEEEMESVADSKEENPETEEKEEVNSEGDADKETDVAREEVADKQDRTEEADSSEEASEEEAKEVMKEESVGVEPKKRMIRSSMAAVQEVSVESEVPINAVKGRTVRVGTATEFNNALSSKGVEVIILETSIHSASPPTVESSSGQKIIEGNGHIVDIGRNSLFIGSSVTEMVVKRANLRTTNTTRDNGFFRKMNTHMNLRLENITFNNNQTASSGMFGSSWESDVHFYGNNVINTNNDFYSMAFRRVIIHERAKLKLNHNSSNPAFMINQDRTSSGEYGLMIKKYGSLEVYSNGAIMKSESSRLTIRLDINEDSEVSLTGSESVIFDIDAEMNFNITDPKNVDLNNTRENGRLFPEKGWFNRPDVNFNVANVKLNGWRPGNTSEDPSSSQFIGEGNFNFTSEIFLLFFIREITDASLVFPDIDLAEFKKNFTSDMRRMVFKKGSIQSLEVNEVWDTHTKISGTTTPRAEVTITDDSNNITTTTKAGSDGYFTFKLDNRFEAGTVLKFDAKLDNTVSETVEKTVIGNRLEFGHVSTSIPFNTTEIKDEEMKIYRQNDNPGIEIVETREGSGWKLSVEATSPLTNENENQDTLENALYYFSAGSGPELIEGTPALVARGTTSETIEWTRDEGILLKLNPIRAAADTEYNATIEWTLSDGP